MDEAHLQVQLCELRLAVGPQVFVAEATGNLEVLVHAGYHQQLLHLLRRLREGVEIPRLHSAGHQEVPGPLGSALDQNGRFDFQETAGIEEVPYVLHYPVP